MKTTRAFEIFCACVDAITQGALIQRVNRSDKEFHFQNWFENRLRETDILYDKSGRNSYPDFTLVEITEGYEVKGLAWPGRESTYDSNSQVPTGNHNGRDIFYVFGNYSAITQCATFNGQPSHPSVMNRVWNQSERSGSGQNGTNGANYGV